MESEKNSNVQKKNREKVRACWGRGKKNIRVVTSENWGKRGDCEQKINIRGLRRGDDPKAENIEGGEYDGSWKGVESGENVN